ncbi:CoA-transferase subunit beta [Acidilobus sp.]|uniref:CoA-transferase subunit beta n=1 Tax=Acidilobus sp. TaxID=1872109 RepID=UPI003D07F943
MMSSRPTDLMIKCMASFICNGDYIYHGLDSILPTLAMVYAARYLKRDFVWHSVGESFMPDPARVAVRPSTGDPSMEPDPVGFFTTIDSFDIAAKGRMDLMFFGAAQVDEGGNINLTVIGSYERPRVKLPGGAAAAYLFPLVRKIVVWARHEPRVLVHRVDFVTGSGEERLRRGLPLYLCTNRALIEFTREGPVLRSLLYGFTVDDVLKSASMRIKVPDKVGVIPPLGEEELRVISEADPGGLRYEEGYG